MRKGFDGLAVRVQERLKGKFIWPATVGEAVVPAKAGITSAQLGYLLEGIDWRAPQRRLTHLRCAWAVDKLRHGDSHCRFWLPSIGVL